MKNAVFTPDQLYLGIRIMEWAKTRYDDPTIEISPEIGSRKLCPFVGPAIANSSLYISFRPEINGQSIDHLEELCLEAMRSFEELGPFDPPSRLKIALLIVFPNMSDGDAQILDILHRRVKNRFVESGLMLAQFHPNSTEPSVHNEKLIVGKAPVPLIAIRRMAQHDILFLNENRSWMLEYLWRFGPNTLKENSTFAKMYRRARERFNKEVHYE